MGGNEMNKIFMAVIAAVLAVWMTAWIAEILIHVDVPEEPAYKIAVATEEAEPEEVTAPPSFPVLLASATVSKGERGFNKCKACHKVAEGAAHGIGPNLYNVVGADIAGKDGYAYSAAIQGLDGNWTYELLNEWLINPQAVAEGSKMNYALGNAGDRAAVIKYLASLSENPGPEPTEGE